MHALVLLLALVAQDAPAEGTFDVRGTVCDQEGQPLGEVTVITLVYRVQGEKPVVQKSITAADGRFLVQGLKHSDTHPIALFVLKHGYEAVAQLLKPQNEAKPIALTLVAAPRLEVQVRDPDGTAVPDAVVTQITFGNGKFYTTLSEPVLAEFPFRTDAAGQLIIDVTPATGELAIGLASPRLGRQRHNVSPFVLEGQDRTIRFLPTESLSGKVTAPAGLSAEDVEVRIHVSGPGGASCVETVKAGKDGSFRIPAIMPGNAQIHTLVPAGRGIWPGRPVYLEIGSGTENVVEVPITRAIRITGTVVEQDSDRPIPGVTVSVWNSTTHEPLGAAITDEQGRYATIVNPGEIGVTVAEFPLPYYVGVRDSATQSVPEDAPSGELPSIRLPRGMRLEGTVVDEAGEPVATGWVNAFWWEEHDQLITTGSRSIWIDKTGRFVLERVSSRVEIYLRADTPEAAGLEYTTVPVGNKEDVRLTVSPKGAAVLTGRVVDSQGQPIADAVVRIHGGRLRTSRGHYFDDSIRWQLRTDADGRFSTPHAVPRHLRPPGRMASLDIPGYAVRAWSTGMRDNTVTVTVGPEGEPFAIPDIVLTRKELVNERGDYSSPAP